MSDFRLAVCSEMVFTDMPIVDRVRRIQDMGFDVEIWSWHDKDLSALAGTGAHFSSMTGYLHGDRTAPTRWCGPRSEASRPPKPWVCRG